MPTKTSVSKVNALLNPTLEETYDPQSMIALVPIHADHKVADIGSGPGWLSIPIAKAWRSALLSHGATLVLK